MSEPQDWRVKVSCRSDGARHLDRVLEQARAGQGGEPVGGDVAMTHDGSVLFAYAATREAAEGARSAIESVLAADGIGASASLSHWDDRVDEWMPADRPLSGAAASVVAAAERDAERPESRTLVISSGKMIRAEVEQTMRNFAEQLGLECEVIEHPHMLTTQVAFTVSGPHRKVEEFAEGLRAEEIATLRTERAVMLSPL